MQPPVPPQPTPNAAPAIPQKMVNITVVFAAESDDQAMDVKKRIGEVVTGLSSSNVAFTIQDKHRLG